MKAYLTPSGSSRPTLIVVTRQEVGEAAENEMRKELYGRGCPNGLLFDSSSCRVFRDTFDGTGPQDIVLETTLKTDEVLALVSGENLDKRVASWVELLATSWQHAISAEHPETNRLLYDVMPAAVGNEIYYLREAP